MALWGSKKRKRPKLNDEPADTMESVRQTSSLPSGVFKAFDPGVEQALKGPVADVFLEHMAAPTKRSGDDEAEEPIADVPGNRVDPAEIEQLFTTYSNDTEVAVPELMHGFESERIWVLADLAIHGGESARELATRELERFMSRMDAGEQLEPALLKDLVDAITEAPDADASKLLQTLLASADQALTRIQESTVDDEA